mgnify:FL=1
MYGEGISLEGELIDLGVQHGIVDKSGSWYSYKGDKIGQGKENVRNFLKENPAVAAEIEGSIRATVFPAPEELDAAGDSSLEEALDS